MNNENNETMIKEGINNAFSEAFSKNEIDQLRNDVQFGRISHITTIEYGEPIRGYTENAKRTLLERFSEMLPQV